MKRKHLLLAVAAAVIAAGGWWFARSDWGASTFHTLSTDVTIEGPNGQPKPGQIHALGESRGNIGSATHSGATQAGPMLRPPEPNRLFTDFTPEERVEFARKGHGPGG